jgi:hypothetical protein
VSQRCNPGRDGDDDARAPPAPWRRAQLHSAALATLWTAETTESILLSTPAGRALYESLGFVAVDEVISCVRGLEDHVLAAIGQPAAV